MLELLTTEQLRRMACTSSHKIHSLINDAIPKGATEALAHSIVYYHLNPDPNPNRWLEHIPLTSDVAMLCAEFFYAALCKEESERILRERKAVEDNIK